MRDCTLEEYVHDLIHYVTDNLDERYSEKMKLELLATIFSKYVAFNDYNGSENQKTIIEDYISSLIHRILYGLDRQYSAEMRLELASLVLWILFSKRELNENNNYGK